MGGCVFISETRRRWSKSICFTLLVTLLSARTPGPASCARPGEGHQGDRLASDGDFENDRGGGTAALRARHGVSGTLHHAERRHSLAEGALAEETEERSDGNDLKVFKATADAAPEMKVAAEEVKGMAKEVSKAAHESTKELAGYHSVVVKMGEHFNQVEEKAKAMHKQVQQEYSDVEKARMCAFDLINGVRREQEGPCSGIRWPEEVEGAFGHERKGKKNMSASESPQEAGSSWLNRKVRVSRGDLRGEWGVVKNVGILGTFSVLINGVIHDIQQTDLEVIEEGKIKDAGEGADEGKVAGEGSGEDAGEVSGEGAGEGIRSDEGEVEGEAEAREGEGEGEGEGGEERYGSLPVTDIREGVRIKVNGGPYGGKEGTAINFDDDSGKWVVKFEDSSETVILDKDELTGTDGFAEGVGVITEDSELGILQKFNVQTMMWKVKLKDSGDIEEHEAEDLQLWQPDWENVEPRLPGRNLFLKESDPFHQPVILKSVDYMKAHQDEDYTAAGNENVEDYFREGEDSNAEASSNSEGEFEPEGEEAQEQVLEVGTQVLVINGEYKDSEGTISALPDKDKWPVKLEGENSTIYFEASDLQRVEDQETDEAFIQNGRLRLESENPHEFGSQLTFETPTEHGRRLQNVIERDATMTST